MPATPECRTVLLPDHGSLRQCGSPGVPGNGALTAPRQINKGLAK